MHSYDFQASIRLRNNGKATTSWHFATIPQAISGAIQSATVSQPRKGRWSLRVEAQIGYMKRKTSIFPDKKSGCYLLPIKVEVRKELWLAENDSVHITITLIF